MIGMDARLTEQIIPIRNSGFKTSNNRLPRQKNKILLAAAVVPLCRNGILYKVTWIGRSAEKLASIFIRLVERNDLLGTMTTPDAEGKSRAVGVWLSALIVSGLPSSSEILTIYFWTRCDLISGSATIQTIIPVKKEMMDTATYVSTFRKEMWLRTNA